MRPSSTFTTIAAIAALSSLAACGSSGESDGNRAWKEGMMRACIPEAVKAGAPQEFAKKQCNCVADKLLEDLDGSTEESNPSIDKIQKAAVDCVNETGLPTAA